MLGERCARASAWDGSGAALRASWRQAAAGSGGGASDPSLAGPPARTLNCSVEYQAACPAVAAGRSQGSRGLLLLAQAAPRAALQAGSVPQGPRRCARVRSIGAGPAVGGGRRGGCGRCAWELARRGQSFRVMSALNGCSDRAVCCTPSANAGNGTATLAAAWPRALPCNSIYPAYILYSTAPHDRLPGRLHSTCSDWPPSRPR